MSFPLKIKWRIDTDFQINVLLIEEKNSKREHKGVWIAVLQMSGVFG